MSITTAQALVSRLGSASTTLISDLGNSGCPISTVEIIAMLLFSYAQIALQPDVDPLLPLARRDKFSMEIVLLLPADMRVVRDWYPEVLSALDEITRDQPLPLELNDEDIAMI